MRLSERSSLKLVFPSWLPLTQIKKSWMMFANCSQSISTRTCWKVSQSRTPMTKLVKQCRSPKKITTPVAVPISTLINVCGISFSRRTSLKLTCYTRRNVLVCKEDLMVGGNIWRAAKHLLISRSSLERKRRSTNPRRNQHYLILIWGMMTVTTYLLMTTLNRWWTMISFL